VTVSLTIGSAHKIGTTLTLWDRIAITAPAGKAWHVAIDNQETSVLHNFTVASGKTFEERIFQTKSFLKGRFTYAIPALPAGSYLFICTIHAEVMTGTLTLE
jgi:plastocyanin